MPQSGTKALVDISCRLREGGGISALLKLNHPITNNLSSAGKPFPICLVGSPSVFIYSPFEYITICEFVFEKIVAPPMGVIGAV